MPRYKTRSVEQRRKLTAESLNRLQAELPSNKPQEEVPISIQPQRVQSRLVSLPPVYSQSSGSVKYICNVNHNTTVYANQRSQNQSSVISAPSTSSSNYTSNSSCNYPINPDVRLKSLPFYDVLAELLKPSTLAPHGSGHFQEKAFSFTLTPQQVTKLSHYNRGKLDYSLQIQMRFCLLETTCKQEDNFPPNVYVRINDRLCHLPNPIPSNKVGAEQKRPSQPVNISSLCKLSPLVTNRITISWSSEYNRCYVVAVYLVQKLSSEDLLLRLKKKGPRLADFTRSLIKQKLMEDNECEIAASSLRCSLLCPVGKMRMVLPCRAETCNHLQCFDASLFLQMNERKPTWICPVCDKVIEYDTLVIDGYFQDVLQKNTNSTEVTLHKDGSWTPLLLKKESSREVDKRKSVVIIETLSDDSDAEMEKNSKSDEDSCIEEVVNKNEVEVITLSDSGDESGPTNVQCNDNVAYTWKVGQNNSPGSNCLTITKVSSHSKETSDPQLNSEQNSTQPPGLSELLHHFQGYRRKANSDDRMDMETDQGDRSHCFYRSGKRFKSIEEKDPTKIEDEGSNRAMQDNINNIRSLLVKQADDPRIKFYLPRERHRESSSQQKLFERRGEEGINYHLRKMRVRKQPGSVSKLLSDRTLRSQVKAHEGTSNNEAGPSVSTGEKDKQVLDNLSLCSGSSEPVSPQVIFLDSPSSSSSSFIPEQYSSRSSSNSTSCDSSENIPSSPSTSSMSPINNDSAPRLGSSCGSLIPHPVTVSPDPLPLTPTFSLEGHIQVQLDPTAALDSNIASNDITSINSSGTCSSSVTEQNSAFHLFNSEQSSSINENPRENILISENKTSNDTENFETMLQKGEETATVSQNYREEERQKNFETMLQQGEETATVSQNYREEERQNEVASLREVDDPEREYSDTPETLLRPISHEELPRRPLGTSPEDFGFPSLPPFDEERLNEEILRNDALNTDIATKSGGSQVMSLGDSFEDIIDNFATPFPIDSAPPMFPPPSKEQ